MSVEIDPQELSFKREFPSRSSPQIGGQPDWSQCVILLSTGPFNQEVCQVLRLGNTTAEPLVFKVCALSSPRALLGVDLANWIRLCALGQDNRPQAVCVYYRRLRLSYFRLCVRDLTVYSYCVRPNSGRVEPGKQVDVQGSNLFCSLDIMDSS